MVKTSVQHKKYLATRLKEDNDVISGKSAAQILFLNLTRLISFKFSKHWFVEFLSKYIYIYICMYIYIYNYI